LATGKVVANRNVVAKVMVMVLATVVVKLAACPAMGWAVVSMPLARARAWHR